MTIEYAIIVKNKTRLETLIERFNTRAQAKFYIERLGGNYRDYEIEHDTFHTSLDQVQTRLSGVMKNKVIERDFLPNYLFTDKNVIIVIGQDGLVANTAKYSKGIPMVAINPDKKRYDGILLPFGPGNFLPAVEQVAKNSFKFQTMRFAEARLNDGQSLLAFNDLFIGAASHVSARYKITFNNKTEEQSSSGLLVSTRAGSTGWLSSVFNMAYGVAGLFEPSLQRKRPKLGENDLLFAVREPFQSIKTQVGITVGLLKGNGELTIESLMPSNGTIFSDGIETDFLRFNSGSIAQIGLAAEKAKLVINDRKN
ncbi:MAG: sugar kinase [Bacteroidota bacterium]|nr:sugar kinase [Bacteroidota bacterium]